MFGKKLKSNRLAQLQIVGAIDFAHAAFAELTDDALSLRENCASEKARVIN